MNVHDQNIETTAADPTEPIVGRCNARNRQGLPCRRLPCHGAARCKLHGGRSLRGPESATYRHGRYSKSLFQNRGLAASYASAEADPELLSVRAEVALLAARAEQLAGRIGSSESDTRWLELLEAWAEFQAASSAKDTGEMQAALTAIGRLIRGGADEIGQWTELQKTLDRKSRLAAREHSRLLDLGLFVAVSDSLLLASKMAEAVRSRVSDQRIVSDIARELQALLGGKSLVCLPAAGTTIDEPQTAGQEAGRGDDHSRADSISTRDTEHCDE